MSLVSPARIFPFFLFLWLMHLDAVCQVIPALPANQLVLPAKAYDIPFKWEKQQFGNRIEHHGALLLPVKFPGCPTTFYMQYDTGSPSTVFYNGKIYAINRKYMGTVKLDSTNNSVITTSWKLGEMPVSAKKIPLKIFSDSSVSWNPKAINIIGTLGVDLMDGKSLIIDYPQQVIRWGAVLPSKIKATRTPSTFLYVSRSILFPAEIRSKNTMLYFDSGSSAFELLTDSTTYSKLADPGAKPERFGVSSWNRTLTANTINTSDSMLIGGKHLPINRVSFMQGASDAQVTQMLRMGIGGMTGNKLFLDARLFIDTKEKKFLVY